MINSKNYPYCKAMQLVMLLDTFVFILVSSTRFCYVGTNANSKEALLNQSCITNRTHVAESLLATEYHRNKENSPRKRDSTLGADSSKSFVEYCYIFRHISRETLPYDVKKESVHSRFSCDFEDVCKGKESNKIIDNVGLRGEIGELFCCQQDSCNTIDKMPRTPVENQICYSGESNASNVVLDSCGHPDSYCMTRTIYDDKDKPVQVYSCDNHKSCDKLDRHGAYNFCDEVHNGTEQLCCCVSNKCNQPTDPSIISKVENHRVDSSVVSSTRSWRFVVHPIANPNAKTKDKSASLVKGLVASIVVVALCGIVVLLVLAYRRRKRRDGGVRSDPNVIMQYERLSCSDASLEGLVSV